MLSLNMVKEVSVRFIAFRTSFNFPPISAILNNDTIHIKKPKISPSCPHSSCENWLLAQLVI